MNKSAGVLLGIVVAVGAISVGGAWYTGTQLEGVLKNQIVESNKEMQSSLIGYDLTASLELVSLERGLLSSTAHYRLKAQGEMVHGDAEFLIVDHIQHGPLPFSRLIRLKWLPVMATSNYQLEKSPSTEKWFAATKDLPPLKGAVNIGYDLSADGNMEFAPVDVAMDANSNLKFSGMNLNFVTSDERKKAKVDGYMDSLKLSVTAADKPPVLVELNGLTVASNLEKSSFGYYLGQNTLELSATKATFGEKQSVLTLKNFEQKTATQETGATLGGRADYKVGEIALDGKVIGAAEMLWSFKNFDTQGSLELVQIYQNLLQPYQKAATEAAAQGEEAPQLKISEADEAKVRAAVNKVLEAKPQVALESLALKNGSGESRVSLVIDLAKPQSLDLPTPLLAQQAISQLDAKVILSKPMVADFGALQAQQDGVTDAKAAADQGTMAAEMLSSMALGTELAKLEGNDIVSKLHYAAGQVEFNGQKMTLEQFVGFVMSKVGGAGGLR